MHGSIDIIRDQPYLCTTVKHGIGCLHIIAEIKFPARIRAADRISSDTDNCHSVRNLGLCPKRLRHICHRTDTQNIQGLLVLLHRLINYKLYRLRHLLLPGKLSGTAM